MNEPIKITREAYQKMSLYAKLVPEISGIDLECGGLLVDPYSNHDIITRDIHLLKEQSMFCTKGKFGGNSLMDAYGEIKKENMQILGLWHSHGSISPFHSYKDRGAINRVYNFNAKICPIKEELEDRIENIFLANSVVVNKYTYDCPSIYHSGRQIQEPISKDSTEGKKLIDNLQLEIIDEENGIQTDPIFIIKEIGERVEHGGKLLKEFPNYENILEEYTKKDETRIEAIVGEISNTNSKLERLFRKEIRKKSSFQYHTQMKEYYENYDTLSYSSMLTAEIGKILAGDYKKNGKTVKLWENRLVEFLKVYDEFEKHAKPEDYDKFDHVVDIISHHRYLKRVHPRIFKKIKKKLKKQPKSFGCPRKENDAETKREKSTERAA